ncbi:MAG: TRAM domain-containing protein [Deltaproteobacteria bacterium]|nr:TRAM domain-containing protein [Deltaproteobacteria bacterium]MBI3078171.1 TRAM domain-containing protein [Deltaproteobacteria bacterium]
MAIFLERGVEGVPPRVVAAGGLGLVFGLVTANLFTYFYLGDVFRRPGEGFLAYTLINVLLGYVGLAVGVKAGKELPLSRREELAPALLRVPGTKILDTSVIIDGRVADVCETGFVEGTLLIPQFILRELQHIADSPDSVKRARGRRGLDILHRMQKLTDAAVQVTDHDFPEIRDVDAKLVALARALKAKIVTNDFNLNKVAELQGVTVLNLNQLANALRPVILPGEALSVRVIREGKEHGQGVAYLDDGTMVVVDNARRFLGRTVDVVVTSVLQTTAGRMIFTRLKEEEPEELLQPANS